MNKNESKYFNTAKRMNDALIILLEHKSFEYITIKEICYEANVNRSTFYLHYNNMNDLLEEVIANANKSFQTLFSNVEEPNILTDNLEDLYFITDDYLIPYLTFIKDNKNIYKASKYHPKLFNTDIITNHIYTNIISKILDKYDVEEINKKYIFTYYIAGINNLVLKWCDNDCDLSVHEAANLIKGLVGHANNKKEY